MTCFFSKPSRITLVELSIINLGVFSQPAKSDDAGGSWEPRPAMLSKVTIPLTTQSFFFQAEDGIRDVERSRGLGDVYKRQILHGFETKHVTG